MKYHSNLTTYSAGLILPLRGRRDPLAHTRKSPYPSHRTPALLRQDTTYTWSSAFGGNTPRPTRTILSSEPPTQGTGVGTPSEHSSLGVPTPPLYKATPAAHSKEQGWPPRVNIVHSECPPLGYTRRKQGTPAALGVPPLGSTQQGTRVGNRHSHYVPTHLRYVYVCACVLEEHPFSRDDTNPDNWGNRKTSSPTGGCTVPVDAPRPPAHVPLQHQGKESGPPKHKALVENANDGSQCI